MGVTITESVVIALTLSVSVTDATTVTEYVNVTQAYAASVSDTVTVQESVSKSLSDLGVTVYDPATVTESVTGDPVFPVSVFDTTTVSELVSHVISYPVSVYDSVALVDSPTVRGPSLTSLTVTESVTVEIVSQPDMEINLYEECTVAEDVTGWIASVVSTSDSIALSESVTAEVSDHKISVSDTVSVSDTGSGIVALPISVYDSVAVLDQPAAVSFSTIEILIFKSRGRPVILDLVTELGVVSTEVSDTVSTSESVSVALDDHAVSKYETVSVTESTGLTFVGYLSVSDQTTLAESVTITLDDLARLVSDTVIASESVTVALDDLEVSESDSTTVTESVTVSLPEELGIQVPVADTVAVAEDIQVTIDDMNVSLSETVTVTEYARALRTTPGTDTGRKRRFLLGIYG